MSGGNGAMSGSVEFSSEVLDAAQTAGMLTCGLARDLLTQRGVFQP